MKTLGMVGPPRLEECDCGQMVEVVTVRHVNFKRQSVGWYDRWAPHDCHFKAAAQRIAAAMRDLFEEDGR